MTAILRHIDEIADPEVSTTPVSYRIRLLQIAAYKSFEQTVTGFGVAPRYFGLLKNVQANPGITQTRLAEAIFLDRSSLVPILATLTREGWVERRATKADRRVRRVYLTADGRERLALLEAEAVRHEAMMTQGFSAEEQVQLIGMLNRIDGNLRRALARGERATT